MSWLTKTVKKISHAVGGPDWLYYPFDVSDDKKSTIGSGAIDPLTGAPELSQMGMFKSMSDFRLRRAMGIGGSRGASRVVNPIGSNPKGAPAAGLTGGSPVSGMPVATSPGSDIDLWSKSDLGGGIFSDIFGKILMPRLEGKPKTDATMKQAFSDIKNRVPLTPFIL